MAIEEFKGWKRERSESVYRQTKKRRNDFLLCSASVKIKRISSINTQFVKAHTHRRRDDHPIFRNIFNDNPSEKDIYVPRFIVANLKLYMPESARLYTYAHLYIKY